MLLTRKSTGAPNALGQSDKPTAQRLNPLARAATALAAAFLAIESESFELD